MNQLLDDKDVEVARRHWFWDNWFLLAFTGTICEATRCMLVGEISHLPNNEGYYYMAPGPIIFCLGYFIYRKEWARRNPVNTEDIKQKVLTRTLNNSFDWLSIIACVGGAVF